MYYWADFYSVPRVELYETLQCESDFNPAAVGPMGEIGVAQIHLSDHPEVSKKEAQDPDFAVRFAAQNFAAGHKRWWTCYRKLFESSR